MKYARIVAALASSAAFSLALAQTQATAPAASPAPAAPATAAQAVDTSTCGKPDQHPGRLASNEKMRAWNKEITAWQECQKKHIADLQAKADAAVKSANAAVLDSNNAIAAYNATVKELQAQADAAK
jgi:hypothetical protein